MIPGAITYRSPLDIFRWKVMGCYKQYGLGEVLRRTARELARTVVKEPPILDLSWITESLAVGAAPQSPHAISELQRLGIREVIDLRAERRSSDLLMSEPSLKVTWFPLWDDWRFKPAELLEGLWTVISELIRSRDTKLFVCCSAGEHRGPLGGIIALICMGYELDSAREIIQRKRPVAEILPIYYSSLTAFLNQRNRP